MGDGYLDVNLVPAFTRPRSSSAQAGKAPFEDVELERLWTELDSVDDKVYLYACRFSCETGARLGELLALEWPNVDLLNGRVRIEYQWDERAGLIEPKDREPRDHLPHPQARKVLDEWVKITGATDSGPVFPPSEGGRLGRRGSCNAALWRRWRPPASRRSTPSCGCRGRSTSLRYTTSVLMQRRGFHPRLIEATLGHGSLELTYGVYGGWTPDMLQAEAVREPEA